MVWGFGYLHCARALGSSRLTWYLYLFTPLFPFRVWLSKVASRSSVNEKMLVST